MLDALQRGAKAVALSGGFSTYVVADRITRASCFVCKDAGDALTLAHWIGERVDEMREFLDSLPDGVVLSPVTWDKGSQRDPNHVMVGLVATWETVL